MLLSLCLALAPATPPAPAPPQDRRARPAVERLDEVQTNALLQQYDRAPHWSLRGLVLLSLGPDWHPRGTRMVLEALQDADPRLNAYALEALVRTEPRALRAVATAPLIEELITGQLEHPDKLWRAKAVSVLAGVYPDALARDATSWAALWEEAGRAYQAPEWEAPRKRGPGSKVGGVVRRAMDLYTAGLEVAICIDTTGSMQPTVDACAQAFDDVVFLLSAVAPQFRIGLVHYRDRDTKPKGAAVLATLTERTDGVRRKLARLKVGGGGDMPERVDAGLTRALSKRMGWDQATNKLVLLVGDAPPHKENREATIELVRAAHEEPFGKRPGQELAGNRDKVRPFVVASIGVGTIGVDQETRYTFHEIARAGGGAYIEFLTRRKEDSEEARSRGMRVELTTAVLELVFGSRFRDELVVFVDVYFTWHERGAFVAPEDSED